MDESSRNGIVSGVLLVVISIMIGSGGGGLIDVPFLSIVLGGTIAAVFINFGFEDVLGVMKLAQKVLCRRPSSPTSTLAKSIIQERGISSST